MKPNALPRNTAEKLVPGPYVRGELGSVRNAETLVNVVLATLFAGMPLFFILITYLRQDPELVFVGVWAIVGIFAIFAEYSIRARKGINAFQFCALLLPVIGIPGLLMQRPSLTILALTLGYLLVLFLRIISVFITIPKLMETLKTPPTEILLFWLITSCLIVSASTNLFYLGNGFHILRSTRGAFPNWLHPNNAAIYGGLLMVLPLIKERMNTWMRPLIILCGFYTVLVTQSRGTLVAAIGCILLIMFLKFAENPQKYSLRAFALLVSGGLISIVFGAVIPDIPVIKNMLDRTTETDDPTAGRLLIFERMLEVWRDSPVVGYGFRSGGMDNGFVSITFQTGLVGLVFYLSFWAAILFRAVYIYRNGNQMGRLLARFIFVTATFLFLRAFIENTHLLQLTDVVSNAFCIAAGLSFLMKAEPKRTSGVARTHLQIRAPKADPAPTPAPVE
ncbi:MAG: O-antigen ligase family protein [Armatimonadetes bacterium]|nr:O-antigen ligase family protein [Armatimonadota bacterium]